MRREGGAAVTKAIAVTLISGLMTLLGVLLSDSRSRAVMEAKIDELRRQVEKHSSLIERTYRFERDVAVLYNDVESIGGRD
jgi:Flp pilus assembly protein protease CpaA